MDRGTDFLKSQINNCVMQHQTFVSALRDHAGQAEDMRFRSLCERHLAAAQGRQTMIEGYQQELGAEAGTVKKMAGAVLGAARDLADAARESDFLRLVGDIVMARQAEDTFRTFREAGRMLGNARLQQIGEQGAQECERYCTEANRLVQQLFVEHVRGLDATVGVGATAGARGDIGETPTSTF